MKFEKMLREILDKDILNSYADSDLVESLKGFVLQQQLYSAAIKEIRTKLEILDEEFQARFDHNPIHHMEYRLKSPDSIVHKLRKKNLDISLASIRDYLTDVAGVRVICNYIDDIYLIAKLLIGQDDLILVEERDYIKNPKSNGYRSLHLIVKVPIFLADKKEYVSVEIQIRTIAMDFWASLEHQLKYKSQAEVSDDLHQRLKDCAHSITQIDNEMQAIYKELQQKS